MTVIDRLRKWIGLITLKLRTLLKGVTHRLAIFYFAEPYDTQESFYGVGLFSHGQLHNSLLTCIRGDKNVWSFSKMNNGRPEDDSYLTFFCDNGTTKYVDSFETKTDLSGCKCYSGQVDKERRLHGKRKEWNTKGRI